MAPAARARLFGSGNGASHPARRQTGAGPGPFMSRPLEPNSNLEPLKGMGRAPARNGPGYRDSSESQIPLLPPERKTFPAFPEPKLPGSPSQGRGWEMPRARGTAMPLPTCWAPPLPGDDARD